MPTQKPVFFFASLLFSMLALAAFFRNNAHSAEPPRIVLPETACWHQLMRWEHPTENYAAALAMAHAQHPQKLHDTMELLAELQKRRFPVEVDTKQSVPFHFDVRFHVNNGNLRGWILKLSLSEKVAQEILAQDRKKSQSQSLILVASGDLRRADQWAAAQVPALFALRLNAGKISAKDVTLWKILAYATPSSDEKVLGRNVWARLMNVKPEMRTSAIWHWFGLADYQNLSEGLLKAEDLLKELQAERTLLDAASAGFLKPIPLEEEFEKLGRLAALQTFLTELRRDAPTTQGVQYYAAKGKEARSLYEKAYGDVDRRLNGLILARP